jgi:hypothetical protein
MQVGSLGYVARSIFQLRVDGDVLRAGNCGEQKQDGKSLQAGHSLNLDHLLPGHAGADHTRDLSVRLNTMIIPLSSPLSAPCSPRMQATYYSSSTPGVYHVVAKAETLSGKTGQSVSTITVIP